MFRYRVFRRRVLWTTAAVVLAAITLFGAAYAFFSREWVNKAQSDANDLFRTSQQAMQMNERLVDQQLGRVYEDSELVTDLRILLNSDDEGEYLAGRRENSQSTVRLIRSFPSDVRIYLWWHAPSIVQAEVRAQDHVNWIVMHSDAPLLRFDMRNIDGQPAFEAQDLFYVRRTVYDPDRAYERMGEIAFGFDIQQVISVPIDIDCRMAAIIDAQGRALFLAGGSDDDRALLTRLMATGDMGGSVPDGALNRAYYSILESRAYHYMLVVCTDDLTAIRSNAGILAFLAGLLTLLGAIYLSVAYSNLRVEAAFLGRILSVIASVKRGDYRPQPQLQGRLREDEYGLIARELDAMSRELHRLIVRGYQLQIRQRDAEMKALQSTINPHFLYNTLEAIRSRMLVEGDRETADAVASLGALYRDIIKRRDEITIGEELQILEKYLRIMAFRHPETFLYQIDVDEPIRALPTVKIWMQPIAENFLKHGFRRDGSLNLLIVQGAVVPGGTRIEIRDNGTGLPPERLESLRAAMRTEDSPTDGMGLRNVYMRLKRLYGEDVFRMDIANNPEGGACVAIFIPEEVEPCTRS